MRSKLLLLLLYRTLYGLLIQLDGGYKMIHAFREELENWGKIDVGRHTCTRDCWGDERAVS